MVRLRAVSHRAVASAAITGLDTSGATMIKLFEWRRYSLYRCNANLLIVSLSDSIAWKSIEDVCEDIANWGYTHIEISPPNEHITGDTWWTSYQPTSYKLESKRGSQAALHSMVSVCSNAGISVVADVITNHMSSMVLNVQSDGWGRGFAGSRYQRLEYDGLYTASNFHTCNTDISNYNDVNE